MSEHQIVAFRAIDGPVDEKNLAYMEQQSSRAEITPWSFDNEYHYGDFRGNADEMLRRGYDLHLHYANFGIRKLMIRLPNGFPNAEAAKPYLEEDSLHFLKDKKGPGGILCIQPWHEPGDLDDIWEIDNLLDRLIPLRAEILDGDSPLYLAHLAIATDGNHSPEETKEAPVPAGLNKLTNAQQALAELYELSDSLIAAAARNCPPIIGGNDPAKLHLEWLERQPVATKDRWLAELLADPHTTVRREMLAEFQKSTRSPSWPTIRLDRTIEELETAAEIIYQKASQKAADTAARQRAKKLAEMKEDPAPTLQETEKLVAQRSYSQAAKLLADLREAIAGTPQADLAEKQARKLKDKNPTLRKLVSELRKHGFIPK